LHCQINVIEYDVLTVGFGYAFEAEVSGGHGWSR
jgi:hypothetical protein